MIMYAYDRDTGMEREYNTETAEMSSWHDGVGLVSYTAMQLDEFLSEYPGATVIEADYGACGVVGCNDCV